MPNVQPPIRRALCLNPEMSVDKKVSLSLLSLLLLAAVAMVEEDGTKETRSGTTDVVVSSQIQEPSVSV
jgi:hypothetical protein